MGNDLVVVKTVPNGLDWNRYGFVAGKRMSKAVACNRVNRLLGEGARATPTITGWDVVLIARSQATTANYHELEACAAAVLPRAGILADKDGVEGIESARYEKARFGLNTFLSGRYFS